MKTVRCSDCPEVAEVEDDVPVCAHDCETGDWLALTFPGDETMPDGGPYVEGVPHDARPL